MSTFGIFLNVVSVRGAPHIYIRANGSIEGTAYLVSSDNVTYVFTGDISDSIVIERSNILVDGGGFAFQLGGEYVFGLLGVSNVTIENAIIRWCSSGSGISLDGASNNRITGNIITGNGYGVKLSNSSNNIITSNSITNNQYHGVGLYGSSNYNSITANNITSNQYNAVLSTYSSHNSMVSNYLTGQNGIYLDNCPNSSIIENNVQTNIIVGNSPGSTVVANNVTNGISITDSVNSNIFGNFLSTRGLTVDDSGDIAVVDNLVNGKPLIYLEDVSDALVEDAGQVILINCTGTRVENSNLSRATIGVQLYGSTNTVIANNVIANNDLGVLLSKSSGTNIITNSIETNSGNGIEISNSSNSMIESNNITNNGRGGIAMGLYSVSNNNNVVSNIVASNGDAGVVLYGSSNSIIANEVTNNNNDGITFGSSWNCSIISNTAMGNNGEGIALSNALNCSIIWNNVTANTGGGILLTPLSDNNLILENIMTDNAYGFQVYSGSNNIVAANIITANRGNGVKVSGTSNDIAMNTVTSNRDIGIEISDSSNDLILNMVTNNGIGVKLSASSNGVLAANNITANSQNGLELSSYSSNNIIAANNITNNGANGIQFSIASNNTIYYNNFKNNSKQVVILGEFLNTNNAWDIGYPAGGNYWSDYSGIDANGDGIGDTEYVIDANNQDRYPLVTPFVVTDHDLATTMMAQTQVWYGRSLSIDVTVRNQGLTDEVDVKLLLFINGTTIDSVTVPLLNFAQSYTLNFPWTPDAAGVYNVTAYAQPKIGETSSDNNVVTKFVAVETPPVGVKTGDWLNLSYTFTGWPAGQPYLESYKIEFLNVTGTDALVQTTQHLSNGTETTTSGHIDIMAGDTDFVIPNNKEVGDYVYINGVGNFSIVDEETRNYAGADRTVLYTNASQYQTQYFWDKSTGALVEAQSWSGSYSFVAKTTETNLIPELPSSSTLIICLTAVLALVMLLGKRPGQKASLK